MAYSIRWFFFREETSYEGFFSNKQQRLLRQNSTHLSDNSILYRLLSWHALLFFGSTYAGCGSASCHKIYTWGLSGVRNAARQVAQVPTVHSNQIKRTRDASSEHMVYKCPQIHTTCWPQGLRVRLFNSWLKIDSKLLRVNCSRIPLQKKGSNIS